MKDARVALFAAGLTLAVFSTPATADRSWVEVKSPNFTVVSNEGEKSARNVAWQLEQLRGAIQRLWSWARVDTSKPVLIYAMADEASMKALAPHYWEQKGGIRPGSLFVDGPDRYDVALRSDLKAEDRDGLNPYISAYWSYVVLILNSSLDRDLPLWFQRGMADVFSNTIVRDTQIQLGRAIPWHVQRLQRGLRPPIRELFAVDRRSPTFTQADKLELFDAECWAFMHFLMFGDEGTHRAQLDRFMALLNAGRSPAAAVEEAFVNLDALQKGYASYFSRQIYQYARVDVDMRTKPEGFQVRPLSAAEAASLRATFHAATGRPVEARASLAEARKSDARLASTYETEGILLESDDKDDEARAAYAKAVELGSTNFYAYYRLAGLTWQPNADAEMLTAVKKSLEQSVALNDRFSSAFALLGEARARLHEPGPAMTAATRAVTLDGKSVRHRLSLARVLWSNSQPDQAEVEARKALDLARTENERRSAQELLDFFQKNRRP